MRYQWLKNVVFFILFLGICLWICADVGLIQHWLVRSQINRLNGSDRLMAENEFYSRGKANHLFAGTLAEIIEAGIYQ